MTLKIGRLSSVIWRSPKCNHQDPYQSKAERPSQAKGDKSRGRCEDDVILALKRKEGTRRGKKKQNKTVTLEAVGKGLEMDFTSRAFGESSLGFHLVKLISYFTPRTIGEHTYVF